MTPPRYPTDLTDAIPAAARPDVASAVRDTLGAAVVAASQLSDPLGAVLLAAAREAFVQGLHLIGIVSAVLMTGMAVVVAVVLGRAEGRGLIPRRSPSTRRPTRQQPSGACRDTARD
jgi:DHA2 family multidrug resistance protein-like MFS transporter